MTCLTALFLDDLPTSIESLSSWDRSLHHIVALVTRCLHIFQWQHRTAPAHLLFIKRSKASLKIFHDMRRMLCRRAPLALMAYCTAYLVKSMGLDIWMYSIGLWRVRHFRVVDTQVARHAAIRNPKFRIPDLPHLQRFRKQLLLDCRITFEISICKLRRPQTVILVLVLLPLWSVLCGYGPHK